MGSKELSKDIQATINGFSEKSRECIKNKDYHGFATWINKKWDAIPEPKEEWEESFRTAKTMVSFYIIYDVDFEQAASWLNILEQLDQHQQQHPGEVALMKGKSYFEQKDYEKAYKYFNEAFEDSKGHCFGSGDVKYFEFFKSPEKYMAK